MFFEIGFSTNFGFFKLSHLPCGICVDRKKMADAFFGLAAYASVCYDEVNHIDKTRVRSTGPSHANTVYRTKPKDTCLDVQVRYEQDARVVYLRDKINVGPLLSHMHTDDVNKIFPVFRYAAQRSQ